MHTHHTAHFQSNETKEAEENGAGPELFGLGPFLSFVERFYHHFHSRTRPSFHERAQQYIAGLFQLSCKRNIERIDRMVAGSEYQSCQHFITNSPWDDNPVIAQVARDVNRLLGGSSDSCLVIDPTGIPKKGKKSVGVARQYCGNTGKIDNCQVAVCSALVKGTRVGLVGRRLYLPKEWCADPERCDEAGIPKDQRSYKDRGQLALELIEEADQSGLDYRWISMDAEFGKPWLLRRLDEIGKSYTIDVPSSFRVYTRNPCLRVVPRQSATNGRLFWKSKNIPVSEMVRKHGRRRWRRRVLRDTTKGPLTVEVLHKKVWLYDEKNGSRPKVVHLIVSRIKKEKGTGWDYKYTLCNAPRRSSTEVLAYRHCQRYWIERSFQDLKDGLGMAEYQVRKWRAWHHHVAMAMMAALYVLEQRVENQDEIPLLSLTDIQEVLAFLLPQKVQTIQDLWSQIKERHEQRRRSIESARRRAMCSGTKDRASPG